MLYSVISPAKKLAQSGVYEGRTHQPLFKKDTATLIAILQQKTPSEIASLMHLSEKLAYINYGRYQLFDPTTYSAKNALPAVLLFQGDVYKGLQADTFNKNDMTFCEKSLGILSGLYGLLSPLDLIQPYRLEMGTALPNPKGDNLYHFWQAQVTAALNKTLDDNKATHLINLASNEYFSVVDTNAITKPIIKVDFKENKGGSFKTVAIHAKRARGAMVNFMVKQRCKTIEAMQAFEEMDYRFHPASSSDTVLTFVR